VTDSDLPGTLTLEEAFRAAYFMIEIYGDVENWRSEDIALLREYMRSDPARADDWRLAVQKALADPAAVFSDPE
jgi:hypothetical protein